MLDDLISVCERAARAGADALMSMRSRLEVREKGPADLVTNADLASEDAIRRVIGDSFPNHVILGEEHGIREGSEEADYLWVVDPLDGTSNYVHDLPFYCVSVAVRHCGQTLVGTVIDPIRDEVYTAAANRGSTLNGQPIRVRSCHVLQEAMLAISLPPQLANRRGEIASLAQIAPKCRAFRRFGASALVLSYMAAGRIDGYWASHINLWDRAAGELLVRESGGILSDLEGKQLSSASPTLLAAGTETLYQSLLAQLV
ncbi:MAG: inositol monophosphatase [Pirellulales bacterium]|nr:inositol monophosphatase [Pirellulales bacterium]